MPLEDYGLAGYGDGLPTVDDPAYGGDPLFAEPRQPAPPPFRGPPPPEAALLGQWNQAKALRLQKDDQYLSEVEEDFTAGEIDERTYASMVSQIQRSRQRLLQEKGQAEAAEKQKVRQEMAEGNALTQAMRQADAKYDTQHFNGRIAVDIDDLTGQTTRFYQEQPGVWKPVPAAPAGDGRLAAYQPPLEPPGEGSGGIGDAAAPQGGPGPQLQQRPDGSFQMTIWNGANRTEAVFNRDPNSKTGWASGGVTNYDRDGREILPQPAEDGAVNELGLTPQLLNQFQATALHLTRHMPPGPAKAQAAASLVNRMVTSHLDVRERAAAQRDRESLTKQRETEKAVADVDKALAEPFDYAAAEKAAVAEARSRNPAWRAKTPSALDKLLAENPEMKAAFDKATEDAYFTRLVEFEAKRDALRKKRDKLIGGPGQPSAATGRMAQPPRQAPGSPSSSPRPTPGSPVPPASAAEGQQRKVAVDALRALQDDAWAAGDGAVVDAANKLWNAVERFGSIVNVPAAERDELLKAKRVVDEYKAKRGSK